MLVVSMAAVRLMTNHPQRRHLLLVFERYSSGKDLNVEDAAFFWLTNASDKSYWLPMAGGTNTFLQDLQFGHSGYSGSYMIMSEFSDQPAPMPQGSIASWGQCLVLAPRSAVCLRVARPVEGPKLRVAVLCAEQPVTTPRRFWTHGVGLTLVRVLPRSFGHKLLFAEPRVLKVWCDQELGPPAGR